MTYTFDKAKLTEMVSEAYTHKVGLTWVDTYLAEDVVILEYSDKQRNELKSMVDDLEKQITVRNIHLKKLQGKTGGRGLITKAFSKGVAREIGKHGSTTALAHDKKLSDLANKTYATYLKSLKGLQSGVRLNEKKDAEKPSRVLKFDNKEAILTAPDTSKGYVLLRVEGKSKGITLTAKQLNQVYKFAKGRLKGVR